MAADDPGDSHPAARYLLEDNRQRDHVGSHPAVLLGHEQPEQPHVPHGGHNLFGVPAGLLPFPGHRADLVVDERADGVPEQSLLVGQLEVHGHS